MTLIIHVDLKKKIKLFFSTIKIHYMFMILWIKHIHDESKNISIKLTLNKSEGHHLCKSINFDIKIDNITQGEFCCHINHIKISISMVLGIYLTEISTTIYYFI